VHCSGCCSGCVAVCVAAPEPFIWALYHRLALTSPGSVTVRVAVCVTVCVAVGVLQWVCQRVLQHLSQTYGPYTIVSLSLRLADILKIQLATEFTIPNHYGADF